MKTNLFGIASFILLSSLLTSCKSSDPLATTESLIIKKKWKPDITVVADANNKTLQELPAKKN